MIRSVFTTEQEYGGWPAIWKVCAEFKNVTHCDDGGGAGNYMQHQLPKNYDYYGTDRIFHFIKGVYVLNRAKTGYSFKEVE